MLRTTVAALSLAAALSLPAAAQPALPSAPAPAAMTEAARIVETLNLRALMQQTLTAVRPNMVAQMQATGRVTQQQAESAVDEVIMPAVGQSLPQLMQGITEIWARNFTAEELRQLLAFYETPIGRKSLAVTPQITAETQTLVQSILPRVIQDVMVRNRDALRQRGLPF